MIDERVSYVANKHGIPVDLVSAIVQVESGGNTWAMRYEPHYRWLWDVEQNAPLRTLVSGMPAPRGVSRVTELHGQKTSFGLMQVMGAVARELGFKGPFLTELCDPVCGLEYGCKHLRNYHKRFGTWEQAVVAYNAGSPRKRKDGKWVNQGYLDKVLSSGWRG